MIIVASRLGGTERRSEQSDARNASHREAATAIRSFGHFKPINSPRFLNDCHEYVFHFTTSGRVELNRLALGVPYQDKSNIARWRHTRGDDLRCRGNTWFVPYQTIQSREKERPHPATFPVQLVGWGIRLHGASTIETMLDPFFGIGNSAVAAQRCGVKKFIGFEIDEAYLAEAKRRIAGNRAPRSRQKNSLGEQRQHSTRDFIGADGFHAAEIDWAFAKKTGAAFHVVSQ